MNFRSNETIRQAHASLGRRYWKLYIWNVIRRLTGAQTDLCPETRQGKIRNFGNSCYVARASVNTYSNRKLCSPYCRIYMGIFIIRELNIETTKERHDTAILTDLLFFYEMVDEKQCIYPNMI